MSSDTLTPTSSAKTPPGPSGSFFGGVMADFARDIPDFILRTSREYGDVSRFRVGPMQLYMLTHPDDIETVLVKEHQRFKKDRITLSLEEVLGWGLVTSSGDLWKRQRKLTAPLLQRRQIAHYAETMVESARRHIATWEAGTVRDTHHDLTEITLAVVLGTLFDAQNVAFEHERVGQAIETVMVEFQNILDSWRRFAPRWLPHAVRRRMHAGVREVDKLVGDIIRTTRERGAEGDDLVSRMLKARYDDNTTISDKQLRDEVTTMVVAGHETTALALTWALHLLSDHESVATRLAAEVDAVVGSRAATFDDVAGLVYTDAVIREAMRLYPPVWCIGRAPLEPVEFRGFRLPKGAEIFIPQWVVHRDPRWYDEPDVFRPQRWLDGQLDRMPRFAYFPFGGGPRVCIGNHFAMVEAVLILATIVQRFRLVRLAGHPVATLPSITLRAKHGLKMTLHAR